MPNSSRTDTSEELSAMTSHTPPQSIAAEMGVLGSLVLDRDCAAEVIQILTPEAFYRRDHQICYEALLSLYDRNEPVDLVLLRDELTRRGQLDQVGGVEYLVELVESVPSARQCGVLRQYCPRQGDAAGSDYRLVGIDHAGL